MAAGTPSSAPERPKPFGRGPTGLLGGVTVALSVLLLGVLFAASVSLPGVDRAAALDKPAATVARLFERRLELQAAAESLPAWEQAVLAPLLPAGAHVRDEAVAAFESVIARSGYPREGAPAPDAEVDGLRARRAVLLCEAGRATEAQGDLDALAARGHAAFVAALRRAYAALPDGLAADGGALALAGDGWIGRLAQARALGAPRPEAHLGATLTVARAFALLVAAGLAILLAWAARDRPDVTAGALELPPGWPADVGFGVLVRAAFLALCIVVGLELLASALHAPAVAAWSSLLAALPLVLLARRHLLAPRGLRLGAAFGGAGRARTWALAALALFALEQLGGTALATAATALGAETPWSEAADEALLWSPAGLLALLAVDALVWAPLGKELAFRGLLFGTLRRPHGPVQAALLCGALFGAVHMVALPALLALTWTGFVYALSVERTRSLVPAIAAHALGNALALAEGWALYR